MKEIICNVMKTLNVREKTYLYRYAYMLVVVQKRRREDPGFVPEPYPPVGEMPGRVCEILEEATEREKVMIRKLAQVLVELHKKA